MSEKFPSNQLSIQVTGLAKVFGRERIVRDFSYEFLPGSSTAITGANGSGKSTLLKLLSNIVIPDKGKITYLNHSQPVAPEEIFRYISFCAPAQELIEEFSLKEMLDFHLKFRKFLPGIDQAEILRLAYFEGEENKKISLFSSGMKQRLKLTLALFTDTPVIILDEPTTNMDEKGIKWYQEQILKMLNNRLIIVASNQLHEYHYCKDIISIEAYKQH
ncbi:MAG: ABC transporter ATP-binding protein [Bacteroidota bacterium]